VNLIALIEGINTDLILLYSRFAGWVKVNVVYKRISCSLRLFSLYHLFTYLLHGAESFLKI